ncbi:MAG: quinone-dependent dihydroorotate dehydrogenase [Piscirickettsiaceae bacterium]|nr:quinone-dependent dihydroorotate dehydrogenase [Piscirickettsiaceae bacterium]
MLYDLIRNLIFKFDVEKSHYIGLQSLNCIAKSGLSSLFYQKYPASSIDIMGLTFPNAVGLAAGFDKDGDYIDAMSSLGFGFVEIGTVTPRPQQGNSKPRLFRLPAAEAIINRMGFNNLGVDYVVKRVKKVKKDIILGINIGKNFDTSEKKIVEDYLIGLNRVYPYADYITINISSPNTPGLRALQFGKSLDSLLDQLKQEHLRLQECYQHYIPIAVKIAPDLEDNDIEQLAQSFVEYKIDAVVVNNTTISRDSVIGIKHWDEAGGLSGRPVFSESTDMIRKFSRALPEDFPIIAVGGIMSRCDAQLKIDAGASLVQIYSGLIYHGPGLIKDIVGCINDRT